ncbi:MAG: hypothetical protein R6U95_07890 [Bacteroidales bacterium]
MKFRKHSKRNNTSRNLIVIVVGFIATVMAGALVFQIYLKSEFKKPKIPIIVTVDNQTEQACPTYSLNFHQDTIYTTILEYGVSQKTIPVRKQKKIPVSISLCDTIRATDTIIVTDTTAYVFVEIKPAPNTKKQFLTRLNVSK